MINRDKAMQDFINAVIKLDFGQLLTAQLSLSEHVHNCYQYKAQQLRGVGEFDDEPGDETQH